MNGRHIRLPYTLGEQAHIKKPICSSLWISKCNRHNWLHLIRAPIDHTFADMNRTKYVGSRLQAGALCDGWLLVKWKKSINCRSSVHSCINIFLPCITCRWQWLPPQILAPCSQVLSNRVLPHARSVVERVIQFLNANGGILDRSGGRRQFHLRKSSRMISACGIL